MNFEDSEALQKSYLDQIDFMPYIKKYRSLSDLRSAVERDYESSDLVKNDFLEGYLFNWFDDYDISMYLKERYKILYREYETVWYERDPMDGDNS